MRRMTLLQSRMHDIDDERLRTITDTYVHDEQHRSAVLVVDDEPLIVKTTITMLQRRGCQCAGAYSAEEADAILSERDDIAVVVTDLRMHGKGGNWLVKHIHATYEHVHIVVTTAFADKLVDIMGMLDAFFLKPVNPRDLAHEVTLLLLKAA